MANGNEYELDACVATLLKYENEEMTFRNAKGKAWSREWTAECRQF